MTVSNSTLTLTDFTRFIEPVIAVNNGVYTASIASTLPVKRYDWQRDTEYWEVLSQEASAIDLERLLNNALPLLFNHDTDKLLGRVTDVIPGGSEKTRCQFVFGNSEYAKTKEKDMVDGVLTSTSIRYRVRELEKTGEVDGLPIYTAIKWELVEVSFTPVPADHTTGYQRSINIAPDKTVNLPEYTVQIRENSKETIRNNSRYSIESYIAGSPSTSALLAALEAANRSISRSDLTDNLKKEAIADNLQIFETNIRSLLKVATKEEKETTVEVKTVPDDLDSLRSELATLRANADKERTDREALVTQVAIAQTLSDYHQLRSQYESLRSITHQITPAQFHSEFSENAQDDIAKIRSGDITSENLNTLRFLYDRYSKLESRNLGVTPYKDTTDESNKADDDKAMAIAAQRSLKFKKTISDGTRIY